MKRLLPVLMGFALLLLSSTKGWSLPPCPENGVWNNCFGTYKSDDGTKYVGEWKADQSHGQGTETYSNGDKYVGEFKDGKPHGQGTYTYANGDKSVGEFKDGSFVDVGSTEIMKPLPASGKVEMMLGASGKMPTTIYVPEGTGAKPLILVVHTSGGLRQSQHDYAMNLQKKGFIAVVPDFYTPYNITPQTKRLTWSKYQKNIHKDFVKIISQVKKMSKVPPEKSFLVGFSNGGYWAAMLAANGDIDAGVSYYGAYSEGGLVKGRAALEGGSIGSVISEDSSPLLMFHGNQDHVVPPRVARGFERLYNRGGKYDRAEAHWFEDADHAFDNKKAYGGMYYNEKAAKEAWKITLEFLKKHGA